MYMYMLICQLFKYTVYAYLWTMKPYSGMVLRINGQWYLSLYTPYLCLRYFFLIFASSLYISVHCFCSDTRSVNFVDFSCTLSVLASYVLYSFTTSLNWSSDANSLLFLEARMGRLIFLQSLHLKINKNRTIQWIRLLLYNSFINLLEWSDCTLWEPKNAILCKLLF